MTEHEFLIKKFIERFSVGNKVGYINLMNGSVFVDDTYKSLSLKNFFDVSNKEEKESLREMGFIINKPENASVEEYLNLLRKRTENIISSSIVIVPGFECNFACPYCTISIYKKKGYKMAGTGNFNVGNIFKMIRENDFLLKGAKNEVYFFGGEPLLNSTFRKKQIVDIFKELLLIKPKTIVIPTNGLDLNFFEKEVRGLSDNGIQLILQVTLDGPEEIHNLTRKKTDGSGSFKNIINNVDLILKNNKKIRFNIRTNISSHNKNYLKEYIDYLYENKKEWINNPRIEFYFSPIFENNFSNRNQKNITDTNFYKFLIYAFKKGIKNVKSHSMFNFLFDSLDGKSVIRPRIRCKNVVFGPNGKVYYCTLCEESTEIGDLNTGYLDKDKLFEFWKGQKYNIPKCQNCKYVFLCDGGDRLAAYKKTENVNSPVCGSYRKDYSLFYKTLLRS